MEIDSYLLSDSHWKLKFGENYFSISLACFCRTVTAGPRCHWMVLVTIPLCIGDWPAPAIAISKAWNVIQEPWRHLFLAEINTFHNQVRNPSSAIAFRNNRLCVNSVCSWLGQTSASLCYQIKITHRPILSKVTFIHFQYLCKIVGNHATSIALIKFFLQQLGKKSW